jgi:short-subunit dehydrogenase
LRATADDVRASGADVRTIALDITTDEAIDQVAAATEDIEVGLLVYNAGAVHAGDEFLDRPVEFALNLVRLNCAGPVRASHHFGSLMVERGRGGILMVCSMSGVCGAARTVAYAASKAFEQVWAEGLWAELKPKGVDVVALIAGATRTPAMARSGALVERFDPADPEDVAREGLEHLAEGPVWVPGGAGEFFDQLRRMPRAEAVNAMTAGGRLIWGLDDEDSSAWPG